MTVVKQMMLTCKQVVIIFEDALKAHPTGRMYSLYSEYLQDCLSQQSAPPQSQDDQLAPEQQATAEQLLQLYKRAYEAGEQHLHQQLVAWQHSKTWYMGAVVTGLALACRHLRNKWRSCFMHCLQLCGQRLCNLLGMALTLTLPLLVRLLHSECF